MILGIMKKIILEAHVSAIFLMAPAQTPDRCIVAMESWCINALNAAAMKMRHALNSEPAQK